MERIMYEKNSLKRKKIQRYIYGVIFDSFLIKKSTPIEQGRKNSISVFRVITFDIILYLFLPRHMTEY